MRRQDLLDVVELFNAGADVRRVRDGKQPSFIDNIFSYRRHCAPAVSRTV